MGGRARIVVAARVAAFRYWEVDRRVGRGVDGGGSGLRKGGGMSWGD